MPCELLQEPYFARVRMEVVKLLKKRGWTQVHIAEELSLSQPLVSTYLKKAGKKSRDPLRRRIDIAVHRVAEDIADSYLMEQKDRAVKAVESICRECKILRTQGPGCNLHIVVSPSFGPISNCNSCHLTNNQIQLITMERRQIILDLEEGIQRLGTFPSLDTIIPQVGLQMVLGTPDMESILDIAGFPGRISLYKNSLINVSKPEFGASEHNARLLLFLHNLNPFFQAILGISYQKSLIPKFTFPYFSVDYDTTGNLPPINPNDGLIGLINEPSIGIEGIIYLCGSRVEDILTEIQNLL